MTLYSFHLLASVLMPAIPPGGIPGNAGTSNTFPQWGYRPSDKSIIEVGNNSGKLSEITQGYVVWFTSKDAAENYKNNSQGFFGTGSPPGLSGLAAIGDFFARLTEANTWIRVGEFIAGALILYVGIKALVTPGGQKVARQNIKSTTTRVAYKVAGKTPAGRAAETAAKHRPKARKNG